MTAWFDDIPVIGARPPAAAAALLRDIGETDIADSLGRAAETRPVRGFTFGRGVLGGLFEPRPWQHTAHAFGHIAPHPPGATAPLPITHAGNLAPDPSLRGQRVKITLNWLRVADYPGRGLHRILFDFYARNQSSGPDADLHFNATYRVQEGQQAGIIGFPIFVGLTVGEEGLVFKCFTVNVRNDADEAFLNILESPAFQQGLELTKTIQPAIKPFAEMAYGITKALAQRHRNIPVQDIYMGLDFAGTPGGARLAEGAYVAVQIPDALTAVWDWQDWVYDPGNGRIVARGDQTQTIPYNYLVLGVSRMT